jgi:hypothetical protein
VELLRTKLRTDVETLRSGCGINQPHPLHKKKFASTKTKFVLCSTLKTQEMEIVFMLNFVICMLQIIKEEYEYTHAELIPPCFVFAFFLGIWVGLNWGWGIAVPLSIFAFILRFFIGSVRYTICILTDTEIRSGFYWNLFAIFALLETAIIWGLMR